MPRRSSSFTRLASEKRGGGSVKCWCGVISRTGTFSFSSSTGSACSSSSALVLPFLVRLAIEREEPFELDDAAGGAEQVLAPAGRRSKSTVVVSNTAGAICDAMKRFQISS